MQETLLLTNNHEIFFELWLFLKKIGHFLLFSTDWLILSADLQENNKIPNQKISSKSKRKIWPSASIHTFFADCCFNHEEKA